MSALFDRYLNISTVGAFNVSLSDLHCKICVSGAETGAPNRADINIYNINYNTVTSISEGDNLIIDAGYKSLHGIIFEGKIVNIRYGKVNGVDTYCNIQCNNNELNNKIIAKTFDRNTSKQQVLSGAAQEAGLLALKESIKLGIDSSMYRRSKTIMGTIEEPLKTIAKSNDLYITYNGKKYSVYDLDALLTAEVTILNKDTGLIERPLITQQGIEGKCLINPNIKVGSMVQILQSSIDDFKYDMSYSGLSKANAALTYDPQGLYWIVKTVYKLDNRGKEWYIEFQAVNSTSVKAPLASKQISLVK